MSDGSWNVENFLRAISERMDDPGFTRNRLEWLGSWGHHACDIGWDASRRRDARNVKCLMMFGPCHGNTIDIGPNPPREMIVIEPNQADSILFMEYKPDQMPLQTRFKHHRYERYDAFSSDNGEDCALYTHSENCCERTFVDAVGGGGDSQYDKIQIRNNPPNRDFYERYKEGIRTMPYSAGSYPIMNTPPGKIIGLDGT